MKRGGRDSMFRRLRNSFMLMHMGVVCLLVVLFFGSVVLINYRNLERATDDRAALMWRAHAYERESFPYAEAIEIRGAFVPITEDRNYDYSFTGRDVNMAGARVGIYGPAESTRTRLAVNAIYILTDGERQIISIKSPYSLDDEFYEQITDAAFASGSVNGKLRMDTVAFKYITDGRDLLFIDVSPESEFIGGMLTSFMMIAFPLVAIIFLLSLYFADRSIRPIERSFNKQREFIADASHELKTPLAAISTNLELLAEDAETWQLKWLGYIKDEVGRMSELTGSLLYLAKLDYGIAPEFSEVNLSSLVEEALLPIEALIYERGLSLSSEITPDVVVNGDAEQLRRLTGVFTDNAVRYAKHKIRIEVKKVQSCAVMVFMNDGEGIPAEDMDKIWDRFYRADRSREYDGGYGLGLPMAKAVLNSHGGKVACESAKDRPTVFTIRLPL